MDTRGAYFGPETSPMNNENEDEAVSSSCAKEESSSSCYNSGYPHASSVAEAEAGFSSQEMDNGSTQGSESEACSSTHVNGNKSSHDDAVALQESLEMPPPLESFKKHSMYGPHPSHRNTSLSRNRNRKVTPTEEVQD